jgi:hypothetical protein
METNNSKETIIYRIDNNNIIDLLSDNWKIFSEDNFGGDICEPINVIGSPLFDFITGLETKYLYQIILKKVRDRMRTSTFGYRCDSPEKRRFLDLSIFPLKHNAVEFWSQVVRTESRETVFLLKNDIERSDEFVRICSMCKKIAVSDTEWVEVESAIIKLKIFEKEQMPQLTHGLCQSCYDKVMTILD